MLEIFRRGRWWHVRGTVAGVRIRRSAKTTDRARAREVADQIEAEIWAARLAGGKRATAPFASAMTLYVEARDPSPADRVRLRRLLDSFGMIDCDRIDQVAVDAYVAKRHPGAKAATIVRETLTPLSAVMKVAARRKWCDRPDFEKPKVEDFDGARALTRDEAARLIEAAAPHLRPLAAFLFATGCRIDSALRLRWSEVDLDRRTATFLRAKVKPYSVPLDDAAVAALTGLPHREGIAFRTPDGREYREGPKTAWSAACRRAGIGHARIHDTRHTFTTWHVKAGTPLAVVARLRGDSGLQMVARYTHLTTDDLATGANLAQNRDHNTQVIDGKG